MFLLRCFSLFLLIVFGLFKGHHGHQAPAKSIFCYSCQGGFTTGCALTMAEGVWEECDNGNCYEAIIYYNDAALNLVTRRCFTPPDNDTSKNFCNTPLDNPLAVIKECHACNTTLCNANYIIPSKDGQNGTFDMTRMKVPGINDTIVNL